jgi:hypothetical protein
MQRQEIIGIADQPIATLGHQAVEGREVDIRQKR